MFKKILIANRGEIACRVIKTARRMGIATVAVYSDADRDAVHVEMADEAVHIGPSPAAQSYLIAEKIIDACKADRRGGRASRLRLPVRARLLLRGARRRGHRLHRPEAQGHRAMGDKIESKKFANAAKVSTVPGCLGDIETTPSMRRRSPPRSAIPVMIKASAGGGGKGMRLAWDDGRSRDGFERARSEAKSSFGDDRVFIEKFIVDPRHIEIQVLGDGHGNVHLSRRARMLDPAPQPEGRGGGAVAVPRRGDARAPWASRRWRWRKAVGYQSAGTVEFIVDKDRNFYFLEMNTRLQVEHPVTELVTGIDLVEQMIRVAAGEKLAIGQEDVKLDGWAVESRLYAEDPYRSFLPSIGRLTRYRPPAEGRSATTIVRNDAGVYEGARDLDVLRSDDRQALTWAPTREPAIDAHGRRARRVRGRRHRAQHPVPLGADAASALARGAAVDRLHRRGISRGFHPVAPDAARRRRAGAVAASVEELKRCERRMPAGCGPSQAGSSRAAGRAARGDDYLPEVR